MKYRWDNRYLHWGVTAFLVIAASLLFYYGIFHMGSLISGIRMFLGILAPIIYGAAIAYVLSSVVNFLERSLIYPFLAKKDISLQKRGQRVIRWVCVLFSLIFLLFLIYALIMMILPQLLRSITSLIYSFPGYVNVVNDWLNSFTEKGWELDSQTLDMVNKASQQLQEYLTNNLLPQIQDMLMNISTGVFNVLSFVTDFLIGAIVSIYVLADKERFVAKSKMIVYALFPQKRANTIIHAMRFTHHTFGGFINGKILDSAIIGVLCYIGTSLLDMPYALLISVIVGVTNVIPFFGPYLGAVPSAFLILLVDPLQCLYFVIFILVLQQFDGNILGPKILGDSTGLSSFMVIVAILVGGGLFGVPGMLVGVPVCAVIYAAIWNFIGTSLERHQMPHEEEQYVNIDCIDLNTKEAVPLPPRKRREHHKHKDGVFARIFLQIWNTLKKILLQIWDAVKKASVRAYSFVKDKYKEYSENKKKKEEK